MLDLIGLEILILPSAGLQIRLNILVVVCRLNILVVQATPKMFCRICNPAEQNIRICNPLKSLFTGFYAR
ncbi:MAG: hypothetical protein IKH88_13245, partial [Prevotella sp.]|nr:hypothetical protein [Prevotella sp.]